jgi:hypothetical protein
MLEQATVPEPVANPLLDLAELVTQPDDASADILTMAIDDPAGVLGCILGNGDAHLAERADRHGQNRLGIAADPECRDPLTVEQRQHDARFDVRCGAEDDDGGHS